MSLADQIRDEPQNGIPGRQHRLFSIHELLGEIFQWLSPKSTMSGTLHLHRATLVCTAFRDPALDILWRYLTHARPLFKIIELYGSDGDEKRTSHRVRPPLAPLTPFGWSRFLFYSSRVHTLSCTVGDSYMDKVLADSVSTELSSRVHGEPAFPCLESLDWEQPGFHESLVIKFLSHSPALRCFKMKARSLANTSEVLEAILRKLQETVPMLEELSLKGFPKVSVREHYGLLAKFQALRVLECPIVSSPMLRFCADLETLTVFKLALMKLPTDEYGHVCLRTVRSLRVEASMDTILHFLGAVTYPLLTTLEISDVKRPQKWKELVPRLKALSTMFAPNQALRSLRIDFRVDDAVSVCLVEVVAPLLELHQLEEVAIHAQSYISVSDNDLREMASSWPNLRALDISVSRGKHQPYIHDLAAFARFCPNLRSLKLPSIIVPSDPGPVPAVCHSLRYLHIERHHLPEYSNFVARPIQEARFLHKMFPNVAGNEDDEYAVYGAWKEVNEVWAALRAGEDVKEPEGANYVRMDFITFGALR
ncbi:hypothetical protein B0H21DRAFT_340882 [Amylocystis lapponica]|nr:hypothetical protein B0H21DRAFT_340882 [Amylocystis lapponica]